MSDPKEYVYLGKPLSAYTLWDLGTIQKAFLQAEARREEASKHPKFDKLNNSNAMDFPPPNPEFLKFKTALEQEIRKRENV